MSENEHRGRTHLPILLLVEDDPSFANLLKWVMEGVMVVEIRETLEEVLECIETQRPDLIVSDLHMPRTTGIELYHHLQANPVARTIPFALLTGAYEEDNLKASLPEARTAGIDIILSKNLGLNGLKEHIERFYAEFMSS